MATSKILRNNKTWVLMAECTQSANSDVDQTITWNIPHWGNNPSEIMFTCQRVSGGRVFASAICPFLKWSGGGIYASGSWATDNSNPRNAVAIDASDSSGMKVQIASVTSSEAIKYQFWVR